MAKKTGKGTRVKNLEEVKDLTKTITEVTKKLGPDMEGVSKSMKGMIDLATAYGEKLTDNKEKGLKYSEAEQNAAKEQAVAAKHLLKMAGSRTIFGKMWHAQKLRSLDLTDKEAKAMQSLAGDQKKLVKAKKGFNKQLEKAKKPLGAIDKAMEGIGSELKEMWKNPMTGIIALGVKWSNLLQKVYDQYGAISKINNDIVKKTTESAHRARELGFEQGDVLKIQNQLNKSFGIGFEEAQSMVDPMLDLAKLSGTSVENTTDLIGALVTMSGYTK